MQLQKDDVNKTNDDAIVASSLAPAMLQFVLDEIL